MLHFEKQILNMYSNWKSVLVRWRSDIVNLFWNVSHCDHVFRCLPLEFWKCTKWKLHWSDLPFLLLRTSVPSKMWLHCIIPFQPVEVALRLMEIILKYQRWGNFFQLGEENTQLRKNYHWCILLTESILRLPNSKHLINI